MKKILPRAISLTQSAFVKGRLMVENVLLATEFVQGFQRKRGRKRGMLQVDLKKAFDSVNWSFVHCFLQSMNFPPIYVNWIMECISTASYSIKVNGELCGHFKGERGLRQGDAISPLLFVMAIEVFGEMLGQQYRTGRIGYHYKGKSLKISHLAFADDILLFFDGSNESLEGIKAVLIQFQGMSGLEMNVQKSALYLAGISDPDKRILEAHGFKKGSLPFRYLGLPLMSRKLRIDEYAPLMEALLKRFGSWQLKNISYAGRLQLLKSVITSLINFWGSAFCLPKGCIKKVEQLCQKFLWSGKTEGDCSHKVAWSRVCSSKDGGGLGLRNLAEWNKTLLLKLAWRLLTAKDSLWALWMKDKYLKSEWIWTITAKDSDSWIWRAILSLRPIIKMFLSSNVKNGHNTSFWYDRWCNGLNFFDICRESGFIRLGVKRLASVAEADNSGLWNKMQSRRRFRDRNMELIREAISSHPRPTNSQVDDSWNWSRETDITRRFSTSYTWRMLQPQVEKLRWTKLVWFKGAIPKHAFIMWLTMLDRHSTLERLYAWGCVSSPLCPRCGKDIESREHLFLSCEEVEILWLKVTQRLGGHAFIINDWGSMISWLLTSTPMVSKTLKRAVIQATIYQIWRDRNLKVHENKRVIGVESFRKVDRAVRDLVLAQRRRHAFANLLHQWFQWE